MEKFSKIDFIGIKAFEYSNKLIVFDISYSKYKF